MYRLVYVSTAADRLSDAEISHILHTSESNNYERFLTGFLLHTGTNFMQVLEGPIDEVMEIYGRLLNDDRHKCVTQIIGQDGVDRAFPNWSMNYHKIERSDKVARKDGEISEMLPEQAPNDIVTLFENFASLQ